tara:strand:+ start:331 stop:483 length:153 start_codon:yes stop_codon:yes gene_type:complete
MRKAIKIMLEENVRQQCGRHHWEWFVKWLNGEDDVPVKWQVKELIAKETA